MGTYFESNFALLVCSPSRVDELELYNIFLRPQLPAKVYFEAAASNPLIPTHSLPRLEHFCTCCRPSILAVTP